MGLYQTDPVKARRTLQRKGVTQHQAAVGAKVSDTTMRRFANGQDVQQEKFRAIIRHLESLPDVEEYGDWLPPCN